MKQSINLRHQSNLKPDDVARPMSTLWIGPTPMTIDLVEALPVSLAYLDWDLGDQDSVEDNTIAALLRLPHLHHLSLRFRQHKELAQVFLRIMALTPSSIRSLDLRNNRLNCRDMTVFCEWLPKSSITTLNLGFNQIGDHGASTLAAMLSNPSSSLVHLDLNCNMIGDDGASCLGRSLKSNAVLQRLVLFGNCMNTASPFCAALLEGNTTLLVLNTKATDMEHTVINHLLGRNRAGRRMLQEYAMQVSMWPLILGRISNQVDHLFFFCQEKPDLFMKV
jgi:hypothetical protein